MAIRGSPAKGVDWDNRCVGSNPTFSAKKKRASALFFTYNSFIAMLDRVWLLIDLQTEYRSGSDERRIF